MLKMVETDLGVRIRPAQKVPAPTKTKHDKKAKRSGTGSWGPGTPVLRIRDKHPGSEFFQPGSRVKRLPDPGSGYAAASKNLSFLPKKLFLSSRKYDSVSRSWFFTHPGSRGQKGTGARDPEHWSVLTFGLVTFSLDGGLAAGLTFLSPDSMLSNRSEGDVSFFAGGFLALAAIFLAKPPDGTQRTKKTA